GQTIDMELAVREMVEMRERMVDILVKATNRSRERIAADIDRDYTVRGANAVAYGLVDMIIDRRQLAAPTAAVIAA
ncbi:MAG: ATP-dependent Clp protease proteolytic subunit, partial [Actinomycetota bacterium]|nr:ATP-dependent Clp protease proteolytic subunit [Actinomycetota bacterium]